MTDALPPDAASVLTTWFGHEALDAPIDPALRKRWFAPDPAFDRELAERYGALIDEASANKLAAWEETPRGALALVLLLDQFTRNVFRDQARAFAADPIARGVADRAIARGFDRALPFSPRSFMYLPFEHGETLALQERSVALFHGLAQDAPPALAAFTAELSGYAEKHRAVVARFGRFPHRNAALGRESTPEEQEFLKGGRGF
jgi:uncharacterized protein (DUF924 family)